jgi:hypothetical protein
MQGTGVQTWPDGTRYDGQWEDDLPDGAGTYRWAEGRVYTGSYKRGKMYGYGIFTWPSGDRYEVKWHDDLSLAMALISGLMGEFIQGRIDMARNTGMA